MDRRAALAVSAWTPMNLAPLAWFYAAPAYVSLAGSKVASWYDRSGNGNTLSQGTPGSQPDWDTSTWGSGRPSLACNGLESLTASSGGLLTAISGDDRAFTVLATVRPLLVGDNALIAWDHTSGGAAESICRMDNPALSAIRYDRTGDSGSLISNSGTIQFSGHTRLAYVFTGTTVSLYVNDAAALSGGACNTPTCTFNRVRLFDGPGASDSYQGLCTELVVLARALGAGELSAYYRYSLAEWA